MRRPILTLIIATALFLPSASSAVGFLNNSIWTSKKTFFVGDRIRVYTMVVNQQNTDVKGTVRFLANTTEIGREVFTLTTGTNNQVVWTDWVAPEGDQRFSAEMSEAYTIDDSGQRRNVAIESPTAALEPIYVDRDTDRDGTGNRTDTDDDNDGLSDTDEIAKGADPLNPDSDGDGAKDGEDFDPKDPTIGKAIDTDKDGTPDIRDSDDDNDGLFDHDEEGKSDPLKYDTDNDGLSDKEEKTAGTNPKKADTDGDGLLDKDEVRRGTDPKKADTDGDGVTDKREVDQKTDPTKSETPPAPIVNIAPSAGTTTAQTPQQEKPKTETPKTTSPLPTTTDTTAVTPQAPSPQPSWVARLFGTSVKKQTPPAPNAHAAPPSTSGATATTTPSEIPARASGNPWFILSIILITFLATAGAFFFFFPDALADLAERRKNRPKL